MKSDRAGLLTFDEYHFLSSTADEYGWYIRTVENKARIDDFCARGLMAPNGDYKVVTGASKSHIALPEYLSSMDHDSIRYYELSGRGLQVLGEWRHRQRRSHRLYRLFGPVHRDDGRRLPQHCLAG
jgi:hypothetical protein